MSLAIAGMGWVTPLGSGIDSVWTRLLKGEEAVAEEIVSPRGNRPYLAFRVPDSALANLPPNPRLRRVSAISRFAVAAGLHALENAGVKVDPGTAERIALVFAISNGGVIYTRRFYSDIVATGAQAASPLLFPETVFNAPASHLAALLGTTGATYTLVGDGAVGLLAIRMAEDLMNNQALDYCLVVGAEEVDWLLCAAYRQWRLLRRQAPIEPFRKPPRGTILSEGGGAILLGRSGPVRLEKTHPGGNYRSRREAGKVLKMIFAELGGDDSEFTIASANGTFVDQVEAEVLSQLAPDTATYTVKPALGESVGAGGVWQVIVAAQALRTGKLPPLRRAPDALPFATASSPGWRGEATRAVAINCGLNQQIAGVRLARES
ncbi:MAG: beta-ketoacyl synthase N-terminal-like domain-containing protein [Chthoniobacterales bacterium]